MSSSLTHQAVKPVTIYNHRWCTVHSQALSLLAASSRHLPEDFSCCFLAKPITRLHVFAPRQNEGKGSRGAGLFPLGSTLLSHSNPVGFLCDTQQLTGKPTALTIRNREQHPEEQVDWWPCAVLQITSSSSIHPFSTSLPVWCTLLPSLLHMTLGAYRIKSHYLSVKAPHPDVAAI